MLHCRKIPGTPLAEGVIYKPKDGILYHCRRVNDLRAAIVKDVSGDSIEITMYDWPTITTKGQFISSGGTRFVRREDVYSIIKCNKLLSIGTAQEKAFTQAKFPDLTQILLKRGATKSKKRSSLSDELQTEKGGKSKGKGKGKRSN